MTLYEEYQNLDIDFSWLGLERSDARSDYFCTPKRAEVFGWAGVDGIHYCFVEGFRETVFAVNPMNPVGKNVHPLAQSFEGFLRLVLACGGTAAVEQAWMWNRGEFDAFLDTYPPEPEQQAVLDELRDKLRLTPMEDPYGYIKEVQSTFDYSAIPFSQEYYDLMPDEPETQGPPERPEWEVYFANGFGRHFGHDRPGQEIPVNKTFTWDGRTWHIPAVYICGKGLVVDFCVEVNPAAIRTFMEKWQPFWERDRPLTPEEDELQDKENPLQVNFTPKATVNGRELYSSDGIGSQWVPMSIRLESEQGAYNQQDWESIWTMEHYGLDQELGWVFWRRSFPWATQTKPRVKTIALSLETDKRAVPGPRFTVSGAGDTVSFTNPVTGKEHTLRVVEYENREVDISRMPDDFEYPSHYTAMSYIIEPEIPQNELTVRDSGQGDNARPNLQEQVALAAIGGADGPTAACSAGMIGGACGPILLVNDKAGQPRAAASALYFEQPRQNEWRMVFYHQTADSIRIDLNIS